MKSTFACMSIIDQFNGQFIWWSIRIDIAAEETVANRLLSVYLSYFSRATAHYTQCRFNSNTPQYAVVQNHKINSASLRTLFPFSIFISLKSLNHLYVCAISRVNAFRHIHVELSLPLHLFMRQVLQSTEWWSQLEYGHHCTAYYGIIDEYEMKSANPLLPLNEYRFMSLHLRRKLEGKRIVRICFLNSEFIM